MKHLPILFFAFIFLFLARNTFASGLSVTSIGGVATGASMPKKFWHTNLNPSIVGTASPGETVTVTVDGTDNSVVADANGAWTFKNSSNFSEGDHTVVVKNATGSVSFTLTLGQNVNWEAIEASSATGSSLPVTGGVSPTLMLLVAAGAVFGMGALAFVKWN